MADWNEVRELKLDDLTLSRGQVRTKVSGDGIDELAESIRVLGLLEPIVVMPSSKPGKFEILTGQRRFLAHRMLQKKTIVAIVRTDPIDENLAKGISVTENVMRLDLTTRELIDACTSMYKKYGTIKDVCETTGLPKDKVGLYVKYDRLVPQLRQLVDNGEVKLDTALRAQDAASVSGTTKEEEAVTFAKAMEGMSGVQRYEDPQGSESGPGLARRGCHRERQDRKGQASRRDAECDRAFIVAALRGAGRSDSRRRGSDRWLKKACNGRAFRDIVVGSCR